MDKINFNFIKQQLIDNNLDSNIVSFTTNPINPEGKSLVILVGYYSLYFEYFSTQEPISFLGESGIKLPSLFNDGEYVPNESCTLEYKKGKINLDELTQFIIEILELYFDKESYDKCSLNVDIENLEVSDKLSLEPPLSSKVLAEDSEIDEVLECFNLTQWWAEELSNVERKTIANVTDYFGENVFGVESFDNRTVLEFMGKIASYLKKPENVELSIKLIEKAESLVNASDRVLDIHFLLQGKIEICYCYRNVIINGLEKTIACCKQQIEFAPRAAIEFKKDLDDYALPEHTGYIRLAMIFEKNKEFDKAINICEKGVLQGWSGDLEKRKERCIKKKYKLRSF
jgi:hypothetical protein